MSQFTNATGATATRRTFHTEAAAIPTHLLRSYGAFPGGPCKPALDGVRDGPYPKEDLPPIEQVLRRAAVAQCQGIRN